MDRLLLESATEGLAAFTFESDVDVKKKGAVVYDVATSRPVGYIVIAEPYNHELEPCAEAWMVSTAWGPGHGDLLYGIAFFLAPDHILMADRGYVSPKAMNRWRRYTSLKKVPLDDGSAHNLDGTGARPHPHHTDDAFDDCIVHPDPGDEVLNYAYDGSGLAATYGRILDELETRHTELVSRMSITAADDFETKLRRRAVNSFMEAF